MTKDKVQHLINKQVFDVVYHDANKATQLQNRLSALSSSTLTKAITLVLDEFSAQYEYIAFDKVVLDLGSISEKNLENELVDKLTQKLTHFLATHATQHRNKEREKKALAQAQSRDIALLSYFFTHGFFPWWASKEYTLSQIIAAVTSKQEEEVVRLIKQEAKTTFFIARVVIHFSDQQLHRFIQKLEPTEASYIIATGKNTLALHEKKRFVKADRRDVRNKVWEFIFTYLLVERGSYFNTKVFVKSLLAQLSAHYNEDFTVFLAHFYAAIQELSLILELPQGLVSIVKELYDTAQQETSLVKNKAEKERKKQDKQAYFNKSIPTAYEVSNDVSQQRNVAIPALYYYLTHGSLLFDYQVFTYSDLISFLKNVLPSPNFIYFLKRKAEHKAIRKRVVAMLQVSQRKTLIHLLEPSSATQIISFADQLQTLKEKDQIAIPTSHRQFSELKWEFIFTALLVDRGSLFNLKSFVKATLYHLAAHFNIAYDTLFESVLNAMAQLNRHTQGADLITVLHMLENEKEPYTPIADEAGESDRLKRDWFYYVMKMMKTPWWGDREGLKLASFQSIFLELASSHTTELKEKLYLHLSSVAQKKFSLNKLNEKAKLSMVTLLLPAQASNIQYYAHSLQLLQNNKQIHMQASHFSNEKWYIIISSLLQERGSYFNMKSFVMRTLQQLANHFNTSFEQLFKAFIELNEQMPTLQKSSMSHLIKDLKKDYDKQQKEATQAYDEVKRAWIEVQTITKQSFDPVLYPLFYLVYSFKRQPEWTFIHKRYYAEWMKNSQSFSVQHIRKLFHYLELTDHELKHFCQQLTLKEQDEWLSSLLDQKSYFIKNYLIDFHKLSTVFSAFSTHELYQLLNIFSITYLLQEKQPNKHAFLGKLLDHLSVISAMDKTTLCATLAEPIAAQQTTFVSTLALSFSKYRQQQHVPNSLTEKEEKNEIIEKKEILTVEEPSLRHVEDEALKAEGIFVPNAGLVILWPFLKQYFSMLELIEGEEFKGIGERIRAIQLIQYLIMGDGTYTEESLFLNKVICGLETPIPIDGQIALSPKEKEISASLLNGLKSNWTQLSDTTVQAMQETFFQREGILYEKDTYFELRVQNKTLDVLLNSIPWSFATVHFKWMKKIVNVSWNY